MIAIWTTIGAVVYFIYGYRRSPLGAEKPG